MCYVIYITLKHTLLMIENPAPASKVTGNLSIKHLLAAFLECRNITGNDEDNDPGTKSESGSNGT
jgi:hypothetical protein